MSQSLESPYKLVIDEASAAAQAYSAGYVKPIKFQVIIKSADETEILHNYDPWGPQGQAGIMLEKVNLTQGMINAGDFSIRFNDSRDRIVDPYRVDLGCVVTIKGGKTKNSMVTLFDGITFGRRRHRSGPNGIAYELDGLGWGSILSHTYANFYKNAPPTTDQRADNPLVNIKNQYDTSDIRFMAHSLVKELLEDPDIMPFGGGSVKDRGTFDLSGISDLVNEFIPNNNYPMIVISEILRTWGEMTGAIINLDEDRKVNWFYPGKLISGHIIKTTFEDNGQNPGQWTSFSNGPFSTYDNMYSDSGFANRLMARAEKLDLTSGSYVARRATSLYNKDLAQYLPFLENSFLTNTSCIMSKTGPGTDISDPNKQYLYGALVEDVELSPNNHAPIGKLVATFQVPLKDIQNEPTPITRLNMVQKAPSIQISKPHWIKWFERGSGDAVSESKGLAKDNTVYWWHNNDYETEGQWSAIRPLLYPEGRSDGDKHSNAGWRVRNHGPKYTTGFTTSSTILCEMSDPASIARWTPGRPIESMVPTIPGASLKMMQTYLAHMIRYTARKRRQFDFQYVTTPNRLFKIGSSVQIIDPFSVDLSKAQNTLTQLHEVGYSADAYSNDARGNSFCRVLPMQYVSASQETL